MVDNENAALRLAHPTVVPESERESDEEDPAEPGVDTTGAHPTVRTRGD
jgi:hypothetical protein